MHQFGKKPTLTVLSFALAFSVKLIWPGHDYMFFNLLPSLRPLLSSLKSMASVCFPYVILTLHAADNDFELELVENSPSERISTINVCKQTNLSKKEALLTFLKKYLF